MSDCEFCPDGHEDPTRRPWAVYVHPSERDGDGQPISLVVGKTGCQHVAESDAEWLRQLIRDAQASTPPRRRYVETYVPSFGYLRRLVTEGDD
jgi:hypothetical protein